MAIHRENDPSPKPRRRARRKHTVQPAGNTAPTPPTKSDALSVDEHILRFIRTQGNRGATAFECEQGTRLLNQTISPALSKLRKEGILIYAVDKDGHVLRRRTNSGSTAAVYILAASPVPVGGSAEDSPLFGVTPPAQKGKHGPRLPDPDGVVQPRYAAARVMPPQDGMPRIHRIHRFVRGRGARGATYEECCYALGIIQQTVTPALRHLYQDGEIVVIREQGGKPRQRLTTSGAKAAVYVDKSLNLHDPDLFTGLVDEEHQPKEEARPDPHAGPADTAHWAAAHEYDPHSALYLARISGKFCVWSILTDSPITPLCDNLEDLQHIDPRTRELPEISLDYIIEYNRAGVADERLTLAQILHQYRMGRY